MSGVTCQAAPNTQNLIPDTLERNISVFLCRVGIALVAKHLQCIDQARAGLLRLDNIVNVSALRRHVGTGKFPAVFRDQFRLFLNGVFCLFKLLAENDVDGPLTRILPARRQDH